MTTDKKTRLLDRLDAIGQSLQATGQALALLGLGSVGTETDRLDEFSDLDFFAIVKQGMKQRFMDNLDWLSNIHPISYAFQNSDDGNKVLYADGIFCEFAVFESDELRNIPLSGARIVWQEDSFDASLCEPRPIKHREHSVEFLVGEAVTNLYVGLGRLHRGEVLSATRFIQGFAVDRIVDLAKHIEAAQPFHADVFGGERRFEMRYPQTAAHLPHFTQGYERNIESAQAILAFLSQHFEVNAAIKSTIEALIVRE